jgi:aldose 1-epimerase
MTSVVDVAEADGRCIVLSMLLPDGMDGFPGNCALSVRYALNDDNELSIEFEAVTDAATVVNFCNHAYFNLAGAGDILGHRLEINARHYTPIDEDLIPTGAIEPVAGTPFDFSAPRAIGERISAAHEQLQFGGGYDHNFVLEKPAGEKAPLTFAARLSDPISGRAMEVWTTEPGIQFYSGNFLRSGELGPKYVGKGGRPMLRRGALCLETQHFPDSVHRSYFPGTTLNPGERYAAGTVFKFAAVAGA